jgi:hypothetical protein
MCECVGVWVCVCVCVISLCVCACVYAQQRKQPTESKVTKQSAEVSILSLVIAVEKINSFELIKLRGNS